MRSLRAARRSFKLAMTASRSGIALRAPRAQLFGLGRPRFADEPESQAKPAALPLYLRALQCGGRFVERIDQVALGRGRQCRVEFFRWGSLEQCANLRAFDDQFADEAIEVIQQRFFVLKKRGDISPLEIDDALNAAYELLGPRRQFFKTAKQFAKGAVYLFAIRIGIEQRQQRV